MAAQPAPLTLADFHRQYDGAKPAYEYWYGEAIQKSMPTTLHGLVQYIIMLLLDKAGWNPASEVRLKVRSDAEPVPDVIAVRGKNKGHYPTVAPALCIEILSPGDRLAKALSKAARYIEWGSESVWIIDPEQRTAWIVAHAATEAVWIAPNGLLRVGETAIALANLFDEVDKRLDLSDDETGAASGA